MVPQSPQAWLYGIASIRSFFQYAEKQQFSRKRFSMINKILVNGGLDQNSVLKKLRIQSVPPTGFENYSDLKSIWE